MCSLHQNLHDDWLRTRAALCVTEFYMDMLFRMNNETLDAFHMVSMTCQGANPLPKIQLREMANSDDLKVRGEVVKEFDAQFGVIADVFNGIQQVQSDISSISEAVEQVKSIANSIKQAVIGQHNTDFLDALISRIEGLLILIFHWTTCENLSQMISPVLLYIKTWSNTSLIARAEKMIRIIFSDPDGSRAMNAQSGWFSQNWNKLTEGAFGHRLAGAINMLILMGLLPEKTSNAITDEMFKALHVSAHRRKSDSVFHYFFQTLDWAIDTIIPAVTSGDMSLLLSSSDYTELDDMYRKALNIVQLNVTGQLDKLKNDYKITQEAELIVELTKITAAHVAAKARAAPNSPLHKELLSRLIKLDKLSGDIQAFWHSKALRVKPYAILIRGPSSVGKSTLAGISIHAISEANNFPQGNEYTVTLNGNDKYQSEYRTCVVSTIFDDFGNTRPEHAEGNPLFILIQFINNMHCAALSPEAEKKGKNDIRTKIVVVTTNTEDLHSQIFSVNPASIMRRFDLIIDANLKPNAASKDGGLHPRFASYPQPDAWDLELNRVHICRSDSDALADTWRAITFMRTDIVGLIDYLYKTTPHHFSIQEKIVEASCELHKKEKCAKHPRMVEPCCLCEKLAFEAKCNQAHREAAGFDELPLDADVFQLAQEVGEDDLVQGEALEEAHGKWEKILDKQAGEFHVSSLFNPVDDFLQDYLTPDMLKKDEGMADEVEDDDVVMSPYQRIRHLAGQTEAWLKDISKSLTKKAREEPWIVTLAAVSSLGLAMFAFSKLNQKASYNPEGAILTRIQKAAREPQEFVERDCKYKKVYTKMGHRPKASVSSTLSHIENRIDDNLYVAKIWKMDGDRRLEPSQWANCVPVGCGQWLMPAHMVPLEHTHAIEMKYRAGTGFRTITGFVTKANAYQIPNRDVVVAEIGGSNYDFTPYMFENMDVAVYAKDTPLFIYHNHLSMVEGEPDSFLPPSSYKDTSRSEGVSRCHIKTVGYFDLMEYKASNHNGMCGSMIFTAEKNPVFLGIHSAGNPETRECGASLITKDMIVRPKGKILPMTDVGHPEKIMGVPIPVTTDVHPFSPVNWIPEDETDTRDFDNVAQHQLPTSKFRSGVKTSILGPYLEGICGYEPTHGPPPTSGASVSRARHFNEVTTNKPKPNPEILAMAVEDFKAKLEPLITKEKFRDLVHVISLRDACSGVDGVKGFDCVNPNTAPGFPFTGPKSSRMMQSGLEKILKMETFKYITEVDGTYEFEVKFDPDKLDLEQSIEELLEKFINEHARANVVFKCNLKDEPLKFSKIANNKIRIFAGAPLHLVVLARMATQTLLRTMSFFPEEFESAVGVDATGKDWGFLRDILKFESRCGDGDFKSYDTSMVVDFTKAAWDMIRWILENCGYDADWLSVVDGIATECINPWYETQGLLFQAFASNPSGHPLTVIINGLANSLYMRYAYYAMHGVSRVGLIPLFHEVIKLLTYGDDNEFSVSEEEKLFNMMSVSIELGKIGVNYTDANKETPSIAFKHRDELAFLKRRFFEHPILGCVGPIEIESIFKSLYMTRHVKGRKESEAQIMAGVMSVALMEFYYHGREVYLEYFPKMYQIASMAVDAEGHKVIDYFKPPSEQDIIDAYNKTICAYDSARKEMYGVEEKKLNAQAGRNQSNVTNARLLLQNRTLMVANIPHYGQTQEDQVYVQEYLSADVYTGIVRYAPHRFTQYHEIATWLFGEELHLVIAPPRFSRGGDILFPIPKNVQDVLFRMALRFHNAVFGSHLALDYRLRYGSTADGRMLSFQEIVRNAVGDMRLKAWRPKFKREKTAFMIRHAFANCTKSWVVPKGHHKGMNLVARIKHGVFNHQLMCFQLPVPLPKDLNDLVFSYLQAENLHPYNHVFGNLQHAEFIACHRNLPIDVVFPQGMLWSMYDESKVYEGAEFSDIFFQKDPENAVVHKVVRSIKRCGICDPLPVMVNDGFSAYLKPVLDINDLSRTF